MMGYDTLYRNDYHDEELAQVSHDEGRVLLTRDVGLLKRGIVTYGYFVRATNREKQLAEITQRYGLAQWITPFKRCMKCNGVVQTVSKDSVASGTYRTEPPPIMMTSTAAPPASRCTGKAHITNAWPP